MSFAESTWSPSALRSELAERTLSLVQTASVTGDEKVLCDQLQKWAKKKLRKSVPVTREGNSIVLGTPDGKRPCIGLVGHIDTVPPHPGDPEPHQEDDRLVGLGASDMKGSLAVMCLLAEEAEWDALPYALVLVFYDQEEGPFANNGLQPVLDKHPELKNIDLAITMEPTDGTIQLGCMGSLQARVVFSGKSSHSARPWEGSNAIHQAGEFLTALHKRGITEKRLEGLVFKESISVTMAEGGRARNVIPERFSLNVNYRFAPEGAPEECVERAVQELRRLASPAEVIVDDIAPPGPVPSKNPLLEHFKATTGVEVRPKLAWTDVARFAQIGVDAINFGPGMGSQAHQAGEWISIEAMARAYDELRRALATPVA